MIFSGVPKKSYLAIQWPLGDRIMIIVEVIIIIIIIIATFAWWRVRSPIVSLEFFI